VQRPCVGNWQAEMLSLLGQEPECPLLRHWISADWPDFVAIPAARSFLLAPGQK